MSRELWIPCIIGLLLASILAGCTAPGGDEDRPTLQVRLEPRPTLQDLETAIHVSFVNTADEDFVIRSPEECVRVEVLVRTPDGAAIPVYPESEEECASGTTRIRIAPGESREWGPYPFTPGEWHAPGRQPHFPPGDHEVEASFVASSTRWDADGQGVLEIMEGELPKIEILPEKEEWPQGERVNITLRFDNTAPVPFTYTSRNGCQDIEIRVMSTNERLWPADGSYSCTEAPEEFTIEAGQELTMTVVWDGSANGTGGPPYAPPGDHDLQAKLGAVEADWEASSVQRVTLLEEE